MLKKTLSIKQPWANLIMNGKKNIEIRKWKHPYRGELLIHTGKSHDTVGKALFDEPITPLGAIIGTAELVDIKQYNNRDQWDNDFLSHMNPYEWYEKGLYGWVFENPRRFDTPIRKKGETGIFIIKQDW